MQIIEKARLLTSRDDSRSVFLHLLITVLLFTAVRWLYFTFSKLDENSYFSESVTLELIKDYKLILIFFIINIFLILNYRKLNWTGERLDRTVKVFIFILSLTIAWGFSTYDFNLYFNQSHNFDRVLLLILPFLILVHPLFLTPFIVLAIALTAQFELPLQLFSWTDKKVLYYALILFNAYLYIKLLFNKDYKIYVILLLIFIGCNYLYAAIAKIILIWPFRNELQNLFVSSYINGWLGYLEMDYAMGIAAKIKKFNVVLLLSTFIIELSALILFRSRTTCIVVLILFSILHAGIFLSSGIFFWKWIVLDLAAVLLVMGLTADDKKYVFNRKTLILSVIFMIITIPFFKPTRLGWYDTNLSSIYIFEATGQSGEKYQLHTNFFSPYDFPFTQNRFYFLSRENLLVRTYGSTENIEILEGLKKVNTSDELKLLEQSKGKNYYDPEKIRTFANFLKVYFYNLNKRGYKESIFSKFAAPKHKLTFPRNGEYNLNDKIKKIDVKSKKALYKDNTIFVLDETVVLTVCIMDNC